MYKDKNQVDVKIISDASCKEISADWLSVKSPTGDFVVAPGHAPAVSILSSGSTISYFSGGLLDHSEPIPGGVLIVEKNSQVTVLLWKEHLPQIN
ncbi:hypothetical protein ACFLY6_02855 [Candidatus Dependentiae bacterium]